MRVFLFIYMIKLADLLKEEKQVGTLYHHTRYFNAANILKTNELCSSREAYDDGMYAISFSRDSRLHGNFLSHEGGDELRFVIDGSKLSERYKIRPFSDTGYRGSEAEEQIVKKAWFCIPILDYVEHIDFLSKPEDGFNRKYYDKVIEFCKEKGIKVNIVY